MAGIGEEARAVLTRYNDDDDATQPPQEPRLCSDVEEDEAHRLAQAIGKWWPATPARRRQWRGGVELGFRCSGRNRERVREGIRGERRERRPGVLIHPREGSGATRTPRSDRVGRYSRRGGRRPVGFAPSPLRFPFSHGQVLFSFKFSVFIIKTFSNLIV